MPRARNIEEAWNIEAANAALRAKELLAHVEGQQLSTSVLPVELRVILMF